LQRPILIQQQVMIHAEAMETENHARTNHHPVCVQEYHSQTHLDFHPMMVLVRMTRDLYMHHQVE
jgi:hypothetical protein